MSTLLKILKIAFLTFVVIEGFVWFALPRVVLLRWVPPFRSSYMWQEGGMVDQRWVPWNKISPQLRSAVVEAEDGNFYRHGGVDYEEMEKSWEKNWRKKVYARGGSTITMQLARNLYLYRGKSLLRKFLEIQLTYLIELVLPKDRILELYLNNVEWAPGIYGAEAAAEHYFHIPASGLNTAQSAFLASILPNPKKWGHWPPGPYVRRRMDRVQ